MHLIDQRRNQVVGVFECGGNAREVLFVLAGRAGVSVLDCVEGPSNGVAGVVGVVGRRALRFTDEFVISHNFFAYAASMPKRAPAKVATSPNPTSRDSWI